MYRMLMSVAVLVCGTAYFAQAAESTGLAEGDSIGAFYVTKIAGAEDDDVLKGEKLCYRCKYGQRPMVLIFTRQTQGKVNQLVKQLDKAIAKHSDSELKSVVTVLDANTEAANKNAAKLAKKTEAKNVPFVVAEENETGPTNYKLGEDEVTVIVANEGRVISKRAGTSKELDVKGVMKDVRTLIN